MSTKIPLTLKCVSLLATLLCFAAALSAAQAPGGVFKLEQRNARRTLVGLDRKAFLPLGINHLAIALAAGADGKKLSADERASWELQRQGLAIAMRSKPSERHHYIRS